MAVGLDVQERLADRIVSGVVMAEVGEALLSASIALGIGLSSLETVRPSVSATSFAVVSKAGQLGSHAARARGLTSSQAARHGQVGPREASRRKSVVA